MRTTDTSTPLRPIAGSVAGEGDPRATFLVAGFRMPHAWMDPFLTTDHFLMDQPTFRPHPHAGFSAVTVLFEDSAGSFRNRDSVGSDLVLGPGDLHWTRAGSGIQHEEIPTIPGVAVHGTQIFVALPPELELTAPEILHADAADVPTTTTAAGVRVRTLVGGLDGRSGVDPGHDVSLLDVNLPAGSDLHLDPGDGRTCFVLAIEGRGSVNGRALDDHHAVALTTDAGRVSIGADGGPLHVLVGGGTPLHRPDHWIGGIAMSTPERSLAAADRYRRGGFGDLAASF